MEAESARDPQHAKSAESISFERDGIPFPRLRRPLDRQWMFTWWAEGNPKIWGGPVYYQKMANISNRPEPTPHSISFDRLFRLL